MKSETTEEIMYTIIPPLAIFVILALFYAFSVSAGGIITGGEATAQRCLW